MQFLVVIRGNEAALLPPAQELALVRETFEQLVKRYPEMDEAARRRAVLRIAAGADAAHAVNDELLWAQLTKVYNN